MTIAQPSIPASGVRPATHGSVLRLTWLLARPSAQSAATLLLPAVAFAVTTALLLTVIGGALVFWQWTSDLAPTYQMLSVLALALLVVPLAALGGAAARLSARRQPVVTATRQDWWRG